MTDRKLTCAACKSAITKSDIAGSDLEFGGELKATNQPTYTADADTDLVATIGTLDEYAPMVRTSGNQNISGVKSFYQTVQRLGLDFRTDNYTTARATQNIQLRNSENAYTVAGDDITQSAANVIYRDLKVSLSTDGSAGNRSDAIIRLTINNTTGEAKLQLFGLTYTNGEVTKSGAATIATITPS